MAANLRRVRDAAGRTQEDVAEAVGIGVRHLQRLETAEGAPSLRLLTDLGRVLAVDIEEFFRPALSTNPRPPGRPRKTRG
ncbi:MAG: helix-turn-helix transcriptional regulator [Sandaracinaceae bacterium]|nr:helix-turn-helix transcriptional regulator [Sandaracinaceae bacterium]